MNMNGKFIICCNFKKLASIKMPLSPEDSAKAAVLVEEGRSYRYVAEKQKLLIHCPKEAMSSSSQQPSGTGFKC
ncbi:hypothetical protein C0J52_15037 [Blattella germanica]|nr:hypothetical protein C0J52_15037 [Blattella germanica]